MDSSSASKPVVAAGEASVGFGAVAQQNNKNKKNYPPRKESGERKEKREGEQDNTQKKNNVPNNNPSEPYIFIIKNAENDLCRIHESALPQFLGLNVKNQEKRREGASYYEIKIRSETRTGELTFHGKDESSFFRPVTAPKSNEKVNINKKAGEKRGRDDDEINNAEEEEEDVVAAANKNAENNTDAVAEAADAPRYNTLSDMLAASSTRPYYNAHLRLNQTTGSDAASSLMSKLVGAVAEVNQKMNPKQLRKALKDVPGFLSCWFLKATGPSTTQFRVVFDSEADMLSAKEMLDQFEADQGIRVSLKLSDNFAAKYQKYLVDKAAGGGDNTDVVPLNTHNEDYE